MAASPQKYANLSGSARTAISTCRQIAQALRDTGQALLSHLPLWPRWFPTEYERAREQTIEQLSAMALQVENTRRSRLDPNAIRVAVEVAKLLDCCRQCHRLNRKRLRNGKNFVCLSDQELSGKAQFRFKLDEKGQIIES